MTTKFDFGKHYLVDFFGCDPETIKLVDIARDIFLQAARESKATIVGQAFHQFEPFGVSGVLLIAESHFSIHTWPEHRFVGADCFTCGDEMEVEIAVLVLKNAFRAERVVVKTLTRGSLDAPEPTRGS